MFDRLSERLDDVFRKLRGQGRIGERDLDASLRELRRALLEADVNFQVAKAFLGNIRERALGRDVLRSRTPGQQVIKIVHDELVALLGKSASPIQLSELPPSIILLVGLQGSGKTTAAAKIAHWLKGEARLPSLVAADLQRPAAVEQLKTLGASIDVPVFGPDDVGAGVSVVDVCRLGIERARVTNRSVVLLDTAGRLAIDDPMMVELDEIRRATDPAEILFIADSMLGQDAVETARRFHERLEFSGCVLTKMDGAARGGAALSLAQVTGAPVKFIGTGEDVGALEPFYPERIASRILGMGDVLSLAEKAEQAFDREQAAHMEEKLRKETFTFYDFKEQLQVVRRMGPLDQLLGMMPGAGKALKGVALDDGALVQVEAIIDSMTPDERLKPGLLNGSRRKRIARGSGATIQDVNRIVKQFQMMQKMMRQLGRMKKGKLKGIPSLPIA